MLATHSGAPLSYWLLGGTAPSLFTTGDMSDPALLSVPSNHSPHYAPVIEPTLDIGVTALVTAARTWLPSRITQLDEITVAASPPTTTRATAPPGVPQAEPAASRSRTRRPP